MKNNKGFTLVELLAIIVILVIIMLIAVPNMTKQIEKNESDKQTIFNQKIDNAAHMYAGKYYADKIVNGGEISFTLQSLVDDGLIDLKGKCEGKLEEKISVSKGIFNYDNLKASDCYTK